MSASKIVKSLAWGDRYMPPCSIIGCDGVLWIFWLWTSILLISASQVSRITGLSHLCQAFYSIYVIQYNWFQMWEQYFYSWKFIHDTCLLNILTALIFGLFVYKKEWPFSLCPCLNLSKLSWIQQISSFFTPFLFSGRIWRYLFTFLLTVLLPEESLFLWAI
jgi:hypothetical protein